MDYIIISAFGKDRPGIVSKLTGTITKNGGNIKDSRMMKLGVDFTTMVLISVSKENTRSLISAIEKIPNLIISIQKTSSFKLDKSIPQCKIYLKGADNEGIVYLVADKLSQKNINIEEMETNTENAPITGTTLFTMIASVSHPKLDIQRLQTDMNILSDQLGVEIIVT